MYLCHGFVVFAFTNIIFTVLFILTFFIIVLFLISSNFFNKDLIYCAEKYCDLILHLFLFIFFVDLVASNLGPHP